MSLHDLSKETLNQSTKEELVNYIIELRNKVDEVESFLAISQRVSLLERSHVASLQYNRRESIEISGLPQTIKDNELENRCIDILEDIGCGRLATDEIVACHRLKNQNNTVIRFVNRKKASLALHNKKSYKTSIKQNMVSSTRTCISTKVCVDRINFCVIKLDQRLEQKQNQHHNFWKGKLTIKMDGTDFQISHIYDLINIGLAEESERQNFLK